MTQTEYPEILAALVRASLSSEGGPTDFLRHLARASGVSKVEFHNFGQALMHALTIEALTVLEESGGARCSFCLKDHKSVQVLVQAPTASICEECIRIADQTAMRRIRDRGEHDTG